MIDVTDKVYKITALIPKGKVLTYSSLANLSEVKSPRVVGSILHKNPDPTKIPCHRVVSQKGLVAKKFAFGGAEKQIERLRSEDVEVVDGKVNLSNHFWQPERT